MEKAALLVIDVQKAVVANAYKREEIIGQLNEVIRKAREEKVPVIYVQHEDPEGPLERGESGWELHPELEQPLPSEVVVHKSVPNAFTKTNLQKTLEDMEVTHVYIGGAQTDYCVDSTCRGAFDLGYHVTLITDGHTTNDAEHLSAPHIIEHTQKTLNNFWGPQGSISLKSSERLHWMQDNKSIK
ncbi:cysteine hydrolase [Halobacillus salinarum]|uniref:Cysteine hydrolase n=1 Tax=Halobacillus salinarum TaxID=2932257 RepID=A0ABY4EIL0_9BACI|nr:cysteine hydrolase family protein [Halobacillus salinarum]UOQ44333.1 cysteine hydrolase [Halobacillus salinarum]